jgi:hypothetical protein
MKLARLLPNADIVPSKGTLSNRIDAASCHLQTRPVLPYLDYMRQGLYLFTCAKSRARLRALRDGCPWYVVRTRAGFKPSPVRDYAIECWRIEPSGTLAHLPNGETIG